MRAVVCYAKGMSVRRENPHAIGDVIRTYRRTQGLTQEQLAIRLDTSREYISLLETGDSYPSIEQFLRVARALGVRPGEMLDAIDQRTGKL